MYSNLTFSTLRWLVKYMYMIFLDLFYLCLSSLKAGKNHNEFWPLFLLLYLRIIFVFSKTQRLYLGIR